MASGTQLANAKQIKQANQARKIRALDSQSAMHVARGSFATLLIVMSAFEFSAACVVSEHPDGVCHLVGFADSKFDTQLYLMLQRSFEDEEQDVQLGQDTYHVEWCGQAQSGYGGIHRFILKPESVEVIFAADMSKTLGGLERLLIAFHLDRVEREALETALSQIFVGSTCLEVVDT